MAILNQKRILNLIPKTSAPVTIHVSQGDVGTEIEFTLVKGDELFVNTGNLSASVHGVREDGANFGVFTCTLSGSSVKFPLHAEMTAVKGSAIAEIVLVDSQGNKVGSSNFGIMVEESVFPLGVTYDNDESVYESILAYVQTIPAQLTNDYTSKINVVQNNLNVVQNNLNGEISARTSADDLINVRIDEIIAPTGEAPNPAEVTDARITNRNVASTTLGEAIRNQVDGANASLAFDGINLTQNGYINTTGTYVPSSSISRMVTDYFLVKPGSTIKYKGENNHQSVNGISFYDSSFNYISGDSNSGTGNDWISLTVPSNATYARISSKRDLGYPLGFESIDAIYPWYFSWISDYNPIDKKLPLNWFERGSVNYSTGEDSDYNKDSRVRTRAILSLPYAVKITPKANTSGIGFVIYKNGNYWYGYYATAYKGITIPANTEFKFWLSLTPSTNTPATIAEIIVGFELEVFNDDGFKYAIVKPDRNTGSTRAEIPSEDLFGVKAISCNDPDYRMAIQYTDHMSSWSTHFIIADDSSISSLTRIWIRRVDNGEVDPKLLNTTFQILSDYDSACYKDLNTKGIYVDPINGDNYNDGTADNPIVSLTTAIDASENVYLMPGIYQISMYIKNRERVRIIGLNDTGAFSSTKPNGNNIVLVNGTVLENGSTSGNVISFAYTPVSGDNYEAVFINHTLQPTEQGSFSIEYNALLGAIEKGVYTDLYTPVLSLTDVQNTEGTFYFDGSYIHVHPYAGTNSTYCVPSKNRALQFMNVKELTIQNVQIVGYAENGIICENVENALFDNVEISCIGKGDAFKLLNTNATFKHCVASGISRDGFNMHEYGYTEFNDCKAFYCHDDGMSHHEGCKGSVNNCEFAYNTDGGCTPAFGAHLTITNCYSHDNNKGICAYGVNTHPITDIKVSGCTMVDNINDLYSDGHSKLVVYNSSYHSKSIGTSTLVEYGNTIIN